MATAKLCVAVVGLDFGAEFVPIYDHHPDVHSVAICDANPARLQRSAAPLRLGYGGRRRGPWAHWRRAAAR